MPSAIENVAIQMPTAKLSTKDYVQLDEEYGAPSLIAAPIVITKGQGAHLWDLEGKRYIDMMSAFCVVNQGHCHPRLIGAMVEQCQTLALPSRAYHNLHYPRLCKKLCNLLDMDKAFAMNSGSEAVDLAIKMSRKWGYTVKGIAPNQAMVVTVSGNFHGKTMGPLSGSDDAFIKNEYGPFVPGVGSEVAGRIVRFNHLEDLEYAFKSEGSRIAAVIVECVQGYAGCLPAQDGYIQGIRSLCTEFNALFIVDEIQTGFGRTGSLMAYQKEGVKPDMVIVGKALTGGLYPVGMVLGTNEATCQIRHGENSSTFAGNPLACAVALEAIDIVLQENLTERSMKLGSALISRLSSIKSEHTSVRVTGRGLFCAMHIDESHSSGKVTAARLVSLMRERGVIAYSAANRVRIGPPLMIEEDDLWEAVSVIEKAIEDLLTFD